MAEIDVEHTTGAALRRVLLFLVAGLVLTVVVFVIRRVVIDSANLSGHPTFVDPPDRAYLHHPWLAYLHIGPGVVYLLGAPLQLWRRFRLTHYQLHRRLGRVVLSCGLISGIFAIIFGSAFALGGVAESIAAAVFGVYFLICLSAAYVAIRGGDPARHRRFMIRAFAIAAGVGLIRVWFGILFGLVGVSLQISFAIGFWAALVTMALGAEWWLRSTPALSG